MSRDREGQYRAVTYREDIRYVHYKIVHREPYQTGELLENGSQSVQPFKPIVNYNPFRELLLEILGNFAETDKLQGMWYVRTTPSHNYDPLRELLVLDHVTTLL